MPGPITYKIINRQNIPSDVSNESEYVLTGKSEMYRQHCIIGGGMGTGTVVASNTPSQNFMHLNRRFLLYRRHRICLHRIYKVGFGRGFVSASATNSSVGTCFNVIEWFS